MYNENNSESSSSFAGGGVMKLLLLSMNLSNHRAARKKSPAGKGQRVIGRGSSKTKVVLRKTSQQPVQHDVDPSDNDDVVSLYSSTSSFSSSSRSSMSTSAGHDDNAQRSSSRLWTKADVATVHHSSSSHHHRRSSDGSTITAVPLEDKKKKTRRVTFSHMKTVRNTIALQDLSDEECQASWYSMKEYNDITLSCTIQIEKIERGEKFDESCKKYCERGLETHCGAQTLVKDRNRSLAIHSALDEQSRQIEAGMLPDPESIALVYRNASSSSQLWANVIGMRDQRVVEDLMDEDLYEHSASDHVADCQLSIGTTNVPSLLDVTPFAALQQNESSAQAAKQFFWFLE